MKWIKYPVKQYEIDGVSHVIYKKISYSKENVLLAKKDALDGKYTIVDDEEEFEVKPLDIHLGGTGASKASEAIKNLRIYPVGSVVMTATNASPANKFGGEWTCIDKRLAYRLFDSDVAPDFFTPTSNTRSWYAYILREGHTLQIKLEIVSEIQAGETDVNWGTFDFAKLGFERLFFTPIPIMCSSDSADTLLLGQLNYSSGVFSTFDVNPKTDGGNLPAGYVFSATFTVSVTQNAMFDNACDKFYWKRIS